MVTIIKARVADNMIDRSNFNFCDFYGALVKRYLKINNVTATGLIGTTLVRGIECIQTFEFQLYQACNSVNSSIKCRKLEDLIFAVHNEFVLATHANFTKFLTEECKRKLDLVDSMNTANFMSYNQFLTGCNSIIKTLIDYDNCFSLETSVVLLIYCKFIKDNFKKCKLHDIVVYSKSVIDRAMTKVSFHLIKDIKNIVLEYLASGDNIICI